MILRKIFASSYTLKIYFQYAMSEGKAEDLDLSGCLTFVVTVMSQMRVHATGSPLREMESVAVDIVFLILSHSR